MPKDRDTETFKILRNWFITYVQGVNEFYKFNAVEGVQLKHTIKRLRGFVEKKNPLDEQKDIDIKVIDSFRMIVGFAGENGYNLTCMNISSKLNNLTEHIRNERKRISENRNGNTAKGFNPTSNIEWLKSGT